MTNHSNIKGGSPLSPQAQKALDAAAAFLFDILGAAEDHAAASEDAEPGPDPVGGCRNHEATAMEMLAEFLVDNFTDRLVRGSTEEETPAHSAVRILREQAAEISELRAANARLGKEAIEQRYVNTDDGMVSKDHLIEQHEAEMTAAATIIGYLEEKLGLED